ncbi:MAG: hypothetical protein AAB225_16890 [Acidobacteriota bacterium]
MNPALVSAFIYLLTTVCAVLLARRMKNWRMRLLTAVLAVMSLNQMLALLRERKIWSMPAPNEVGEFVELIVSSVFLLTIPVLEMEMRERRRTEARLRLAEAEGSGAIRKVVRRVVRYRSPDPLRRRKAPEAAPNLPDAGPAPPVA